MFEHIPIPEDFVGFDPLYHDPARTEDSYRRNLPHWRYEGATYFITFRLNDSVPRDAAVAMKEAAAKMQQAVAEEKLACGGKLTATTLKKWEDFQKRHFRKLEGVMDEGHGQCVLRDPKLRGVVETALLHFEGQRCRMEAFVIMPNHVHALCRPLTGFDLEDLAGSWKKYSAAEINLRLRRGGQLWQRENFDRIIRDGLHYARVVRYIARNPVKARLREDEVTVWVNDEIQEANVERVCL